MQEVEISLAARIRLEGTMDTALLLLLRILSFNLIDYFQRNAEENDSLTILNKIRKEKE